MSETLNLSSNPSRSIPDDRYFIQEAVYDIHSEDWKRKSTPATNSIGDVAVNVDDVWISAAAIGEVDFASVPRMPIKKTLSRKGSQRGNEKKVPESAASIAAVSASVVEKSACLIRVASEDEGEMLRLVTSPTVGPTGRFSQFRRLTFRRQSPWLDPRRILILFATLSSMGTLILLYFTLSMGNIRGRD